MATISNNIKALKDVKENIKTALQNKGVDMNGVPFTDYSNKIDDIEVGGGLQPGEKIKVTDLGIKFANSTFSTFPHNYFDMDGCNYHLMFDNCQNLERYEQKGTSYAHSCYRAFSYCYNLKYAKVNFPSETQEMFLHCRSLTGVSIDTRFVNVFDNMFKSCSSLESMSLDFQGANYPYPDGIFEDCTSLKEVYIENTQKLIGVTDWFKNCTSLETAPSFDTSNLMGMGGMFIGCTSLKTIPEYNSQNFTEIKHMFSDENGTELTNLTDVGGFVGLSCNWDDDYSLSKCPNLTYQSCINILNGLSDMTGSESKNLKVHQNFINKVGDNISIATNKNWNVYA